MSRQEWSLKRPDSTHRVNTRSFEPRHSMCSRYQTLWQPWLVENSFLLWRVVSVPWDSNQVSQALYDICGTLPELLGLCSTHPKVRVLCRRILSSLFLRLGSKSCVRCIIVVSGRINATEQRQQVIKSPEKQTQMRTGV
jgi:hypothetical protein